MDHQMKKSMIHWHRLIMVALVSMILLGAGLYRITIDTDILSVMPTDDPVIADSAAIFRHHPLQNRILIDISIDRKNPESLVQMGNWMIQRLKKSGLFKTAGTESFQKAMPQLLHHVVNNLPVLFTERELKTKVAPLLAPEAIKQQIKDNYLQLLSLESVGQADFMTRDPLRFRDIILAKLTSLSPSDRIIVHQGHLLSIDGKHLLLVAQPRFSGTDTVFARQMTALIDQIKKEVKKESLFSKEVVKITPMGAYRAALDNELLIRRDVTVALIAATLGIALLLILAFPRPGIGLLSFLPAIVGTASALFVYSIFNHTISIMVLGFGGAIISITIDHGIAYLLFLDHPLSGNQINHTSKIDPHKAALEVRSIGLLTVLTTVGAFIVLCFSGFPVFVQLGQFAALGIAFSFLFVHSVFPVIFSKVPPSPKENTTFRNVVAKLSGLGSKGAWAMGLLMVIMLFFAVPHFDVGMQAMNTVSKDTRAADRHITRVWGNFNDRIYLMTTGQNIEQLRDQGDQLIASIASDIRSGVLNAGFVPSLLYPGSKRRLKNFTAWQTFWDSDKAAAIKTIFQEEGVQYGFSDEAFAPFIQMITTQIAPTISASPPEFLFDLLGLARTEKEGQMVQLLTLFPGERYDGDDFRTKYADLGKVFDANRFSEALGSLLFKTFIKLLVLVAISVVVLLLFFFIDFKRTVVTLLPVAFALIATVGTLNLFGRPIDIPGLMLAVVVLGMGIDYSLFFVRAHQRYNRMNHPMHRLVQMAVLMAAISTLIGFGVLIFARHSLLQSAGLTSFLGIGYALAGAFFILPPLLTHIGRERPNPISKDLDIKKRVLSRYRHMEAYPRLFARFKLKLDPIFSEIGDLLLKTTSVRTIIDVGTGYGVPGSWLLERFPKASLYGIEPIANRVRVASQAVSDRGIISVGHAPDLPDVPGPVDLAVMLDMVHFLDDEALNLVLNRLCQCLKSSGLLLIRVSVRPKRNYPWVWWMENAKLKCHNITAYYRDEKTIAQRIKKAGFHVSQMRFSGPHQEMVWLVCRTS